MRAKLQSVALALAGLMLVGILAQAALAGQAWFAGAGLIGLHGGLGHGVFALGIATAALLWIARARPLTAALATLVALAMVAQIGLGYVGHRTGVGSASALHIPLGVLLATGTAAVTTKLAVDQSTTRS